MEAPEAQAPAVLPPAVPSAAPEQVSSQLAEPASAPLPVKEDAAGPTADALTASVPSDNVIPPAVTATSEPVLAQAPVPAPAPSPALPEVSTPAPAPALPQVPAPAPDDKPAPAVDDGRERALPGISSVADFIPANAQLDQPTPSPSEPLGDGTTDAQEDATMHDAAPASLSYENVTLKAEPVTAAAPSLEATLQVESVPTPPAPITNGTTPRAMSPPAQQPHPQVQVTPTTHTPPPAPQFKTETALPSQATQPEAADPLPPPVDMPEHAVFPPASTAAPVDTQMQDPIPSLTRPREEDADEEPDAKRARLDESAILDTPIETPVNGEFKRPDLPNLQDQPSPAVTQAPAVLPTANGNATGHLPPRSTYSTEPLTKYQRKTLEEKIKNTKKVKSAVVFLKPVDPVALNIPNYPNVIKQPMDLGTMESKLKSDQYSSLEDFVNDFELMVNNCFTFNGPAHAVSGMAMNLRAYFLKQMDSVPTGEAASAPQKPPKKESPVAKPQPRRESRASTGPGAPVLAKSPGAAGDTFALLPGGTPQIRRDSTAGRPKRAVVPPAPRDLPYSGSKPKRKENQVGLKFAEHVFNDIRKPRYSKQTAFFLEPVDPVALNIPHYFSVIKHPMDMQTISNKLKTGQYATADEFKADFELMLANAIKFNPPDNIVHQSAKEVLGIFESLWAGKNRWIKDHQPRSARVTPTSDGESDEGEESEEEERDPGDDAKEATIRALKAQLETMQNMLGAISGAKRDSPKASGKKKSRASGGASGKPKKGSTSAASGKAGSKAKPKKQRLVTLEEKQEISNATEHMSEEQIAKLTQLVVESNPKYQDKDEMELDIDDLPNEVQHKLLKYVRSIFPRATRDDSQDAIGVDDDYEPERGGASTKSGRKKHKPMKKHEQEERIAQLNAKVEAMRGGLTSGGAGAAAAAQAESSDDEDSESSEEE